MNCTNMEVEEVVNYTNITQATFELNDALTNAETQEEKEALTEMHIKKFEIAPVCCYLPEMKDLQWLNINTHLNLNKDVKGKIIILDFFTYCCINCMHLLPYLANLEKNIPIRMVGVHSGKFYNERSSANVLKAISKLHIEHPVINDEENYLWNKLSVICWPTVFIIGPEQQILFSFIGEGSKDQLELYTDVTLSYFKKQNRISSDAASFTMQKLKTSVEILNFPGKISCNSGELLAVSDTGNHRILVISKDGIIQNSVGGCEPGFIDGKFSSSRFRSPQGVTWISSDIRTLFKTESALRSPWDIIYFSTKQNSSTNNILLIAAAGSHQIWAYFFDDTLLLNKNYLSGDCVAIAGNGKEENRNNLYPHRAGFAQPSGLTICEVNGEQQLLLADSESSSIRLMCLSSGKVVGLVGGELDPLNLFGFGDTDGKGINAKLQHPMGIVWNEKLTLAYVADTYNHKIKIVDPILKTCTTFSGQTKIDNQKTEFDEPNGLAIDPNYSKLYIADTNNHSIKILDLDNRKLKTLTVRWKPRQFRLQPNHTVTCKQTSVHPNRFVQLNSRVTVSNAVHINTEAPNSVKTYIRNDIPVDITKNDQINSDTSISFSYTFSCFTDCLPESTINVEIEAEVYCCQTQNGSCWKRIIVFRLPIFITNSAMETIDPIVQVDYCIPSDSFNN
uniref:Thioredoxin-like fold domain-containing protein n=1 Tax=Strigamia maritima TaxID=126957 RepID=T1IW47_STRMM